MRSGRWLLLCLLLSLSGCVEVNTYVGSRGKVTQEIIAYVPRLSAEGFKRIAQDYLGRQWSVRVEGAGEQRFIYARRTFPAIPEGKPMLGVSVKFQRRNRWFRATYELQVSYKPKELLQTPYESELIADRKATVRFYIPGRIVPELSNVPAKDTDFVELAIDPTKPLQVKITSIGIIWWRVVLLLVIIIGLLWLAAPYLPRIAERLQRRTVKVVQR